LYFVLLFASVIMLGPFLWQFFSSLKPQGHMFTKGLSLFARDDSNKILMTLDNYREVFHELKFLLYFWNTFLVASVNIFLNIFLNSLAGYAFARIRFPGRDTIFRLLLATMMVPGTVLLIPQVYIIKNLGLYNQLGALILPFIMSIYNVFMMRQFFYSIPISVEESALIDGATRFQVFTRIAMPLVKPALVTLGIMTFIWNYNNYLWPLVVINDKLKYTISLGMGQLITVGQTKAHLMIAASIIVSIPSILVFLIFQKQIVSGIMAGSVKE
ncbi:MAG: carbohydrate ABC transporter permease, partial [Spirochaetaceae bacterium]|nr:carbohydrate ABC transporter permease [Spirochaetaceae bacterium]